MTPEEQILETWDHLMPDAENLAIGLSRALQGDASAGELAILRREPSPYTSTFPSEIVTCRNGHGEELRLFCKYGVDIWQAYRPPAGRYARRGVPYELAVYQHVLQPSGLSAPALFGGYADPVTGHTWLIVQYVEGAQLPEVPHLEPVPQAAHWIGRFHCVNESRLAHLPEGLLIQYDAEHYRGYARRTWEFASEDHRRLSWLRTLCERSGEVIEELLAPPLTVIHGEYCPANILYAGGAICPVDWESAAVAAGEIDLAALSDGHWPEIVQACEVEYQRARWPEGTPPGFQRKLALARVYWAFRWLGEAEAAIRDDSEWRLDPLRRAGEQTGLI